MELELVESYFYPEQGPDLEAPIAERLLELLG